MKTFSCSNCGQMIFFENVRCGNCGSPLGYISQERIVTAFSTQPDGAWKTLGDTANPRYRPCRNYHQENVCNWMVASDSPHELCRSCRYTEVIPHLSLPENRQYWFDLESAKRRLIHSLDGLGLAIPGRQDDNERGLAFHFLADKGPDKKVMTGHDAGLITLNIAEANDVEREKQRTAMGEPYRTLLGHFRHEIGHFYWEYLIANGPWLPAFREIFGDESEDYAAALKKHYESESDTNWSQQYISTYASTHPWEDWAETWAHYMHIMDALETAHHWGASFSVHNKPNVTAAVNNPETPSLEFRDVLVRQWLPLTQFLNSMNRSLGQRDGYPFVLANAVVKKLSFVHRVVQSAKNVAWTDWPPPYTSTQSAKNGA